MRTYCSPAITPGTCTECDEPLPDGSAGVYVEGYGYGSKRFEMTLCPWCVEELEGQLRDTLQEAQSQAADERDS